jgi:hypothetical protein
MPFWKITKVQSDTYGNNYKLGRHARPQKGIRYRIV